MNILIFLGPAGSGKGTQAQYLKEHFDFVHLSTGDLLRQEVSSGSKLGQEVQSVIRAGDLVSDDIILSIIKEQLLTLKERKMSKGIVFDGFPRTIEQAKAFDIMLNSLGLSLNKLVYFDLSLDASLSRISGRQIDSRNNLVYHKDTNPAPKEAEPFLVSRDDDNVEKVKHRFQVYQTETSPLISHYQDQLLRIDCMKSIKDIHSLFDELVQSFHISV